MEWRGGEWSLDVCVSGCEWYRTMIVEGEATTKRCWD
jgi:hypothetical protein